MNEEQLAKAKAILYYKENHELKQEIERLTNELEREKSKVKEYGSRMLKAIEELETWNCMNKAIQYEIDYLLELLRGEDNDSISNR